MAACALAIPASATQPDLSSAPVGLTSVAEDSYGRLISGNGRCLDLDHGVGPAILHWTCNGQSNQQWRLVP